MLRRTYLYGFCEENRRVNGWIGIGDSDDAVDLSFNLQTTKWVSSTTTVTLR